jgi:hypothetical protein
MHAFFEFVHFSKMTRYADSGKPPSRVVHAHIRPRQFFRPAGQKAVKALKEVI